jgi:hypothetical protein
MVPTETTPLKKKAECLAKCLSLPECETVVATNKWDKCFIAGFGTVRKAAKHWTCYERVMTDMYSFVELKDKSCHRWKPPSASRSRVIDHTKPGMKESEIRACQVDCANDDECDAVWLSKKKCVAQLGGDKPLNIRPRVGHDCHEKTLSEVAKAQVCWMANNLGICDKAYDNSSSGLPGSLQSDCETDFAVNGFGFDGAETGSKFCKFLTRKMHQTGNSLKREVHPISTMTSLANMCGELCPSRTKWTYEAKKCTKKLLRKTRQKHKKFQLVLGKMRSGRSLQGYYQKIKNLHISIKS